MDLDFGKPERVPVDQKSPSSSQITSKQKKEEKKKK